MMLENAENCADAIDHQWYNIVIFIHSKLSQLAHTHTRARALLNAITVRPALDEAGNSLKPGTSIPVTHTHTGFANIVQILVDWRG